MSQTDLILAIDAGNSRTKWGVFGTAGELQTHGVFMNAQFDPQDVPLAWRNCSKAIISNVAGPDMAMRLSAALQPLHIQAVWVQSAAYRCGLINSYQPPEQLGTDRWAAAVAAWHLYRAPCLVLNAGTALTIDALSPDAESKDGVFLGGLIAPGFRLMQDSLYQRTAGIGEYPGSLQAFPCNTGDAVYSGALTAMLGAVSVMWQHLQQHLTARQQADSVRCIITGGDASLMAQAMNNDAVFAGLFADLDKQVVIADNLVLQGLLLLGKEAS